MKRRHPTSAVRPGPPGQFQYFTYGPLEFNITRAHLLAANRRKYQPHWRQPSMDMVGPDTDIDPAQVERAEIGKPVLFATLALEGHPPELLIDGNHRVLKALRQGKRVRAILLDLEDTLRVVRGPEHFLQEMRENGRRRGMLAPGQVPS